MTKAAVPIRLRPRFKVRVNQVLASIALRISDDLRFATRPVKMTKVAVPTRHGDVTCRIYWPHSDAPLAGDGTNLPPVHLQIHGGAFYLRLPDQDDHINTYIASEVGAVVVNPDYDVAPAVQFPVAEEQCFDVLQWIVEQGSNLGWDTTRVSVGGTSAGGKLAINMAQMVHASGLVTLKSIALGCAFIDATRSDRTSSKRRPMVNRSMQDLLLDSYFADASRRREPLASPLFDPDLEAAMPPTLITTGGLDTLGPEMDKLAGQLQNAGVDVSHTRFAEADHGFSHFKPVDIARESIELLGAHILSHSQH